MNCLCGKSQVDTQLSLQNTRVNCDPVASVVSMQKVALRPIHQESVSMQKVALRPIHQESLRTSQLHTL